MRLSQQWGYLNTTLNENQYHLHYLLQLVSLFCFRACFILLYDLGFKARMAVSFGQKFYCLLFIVYCLLFIVYCLL